MSRWSGTRSTVYGVKGMVSCGQPLAAEVGASMLRAGGSSADAAVACAAAMAFLQPSSNGIGGDCFALYHDGSMVHGLNASGRSPASLHEYPSSEGQTSIPWNDAKCITVPGAVGGWIALHEKFGKLPLDQVLAPAIRLARDGAPLGPMTAAEWAHGKSKLTAWKMEHQSELLRADGETPQAGKLWKNPSLANVIQEVAEKGAAGFYEGWVAEAIVKAVQANGGVLSAEDLKNNQADWVTPISTTYRDQVELWEIPPNGQGITAIIALNILEQLMDGDQPPPHNEAEHLHLLTESLRAAFADSTARVGEHTSAADIARMCSKEYAKERAALLSKSERCESIGPGAPADSSDTIYLCVVDEEGHGCSFIQSNYAGFGSGLNPKGTGITLQNRGSNFSLDPLHINCVGPGKRPYHTIIPGMLTRKGGKELMGPFGVMGGFMQPQGHLQVVANIVDYKMDPQAAFDAHRICISPVAGNVYPTINVEPAISSKTQQQLRSLGHPVKLRTGESRSIFGRGYMVLRQEDGVLAGASEPRSDGCCATII